MKLLILFLLIFLTSGCADYRELSDMAMVSNIAITKEDDNYRIIVQVLDSKSSSGDKQNASPSVILYENSGKTLHETFRNVTLESPKKLYVGHVDTVIVSKDLLKDGASEFIDFILRDPEFEKSFNLLTTDDDIDEVMNIIPPLVSIPSEDVSSSIEISSKIQGMVDNVNFDEFVSNILVEGIDPVLPSIYIKEMKSYNEEVNPEKRLVLDKRLNVFKDDKYISYISEDASLGFNLLNNNITSPIISFKCDKDKYGSIEVVDSKASFSYDKDKNKINIKIDLQGVLSELNCNIDISKDEGVKKIEDKLEEKIKNSIKKTIEEEKMTKSDFLGIGKYLYQNDYNYYEKVKDDMDEIIQNISSDIKVKVTYSHKASIKKGDEKH